jgi:hypothetical protein
MSIHSILCKSSCLNSETCLNTVLSNDTLVLSFSSIIIMIYTFFQDLYIVLDVELINEGI